MNSKFSWLVLALVVLAVIFVPLVPSVSSLDCIGDASTECDDSVAYISVYQKFFK